MNVYLFLLIKTRLYINFQLWNDAHERNEVPTALNNSLKELKLDYIDLYLMHYPMAYTVRTTSKLLFISVTSFQLKIK